MVSGPQLKITQWKAIESAEERRFREVGWFCVEVIVSRTTYCGSVELEKTCGRVGSHAGLVVNLAAFVVAWSTYASRRALT